MGLAFLIVGDMAEWEPKGPLFLIQLKTGLFYYCPGGWGQAEKIM